jgi:hypothetical protein
MNKQDNDNQTSLEDLPVTEGQSDEAKGGLNYTKIQFDYKPQKPDGSL